MLQVYEIIFNIYLLIQLAAMVRRIFQKNYIILF